MILIGFLFSEKRQNQIYVNLWHGSSPKKKGYLLSDDNLAPQDYDYYKLAQRKTDFLIVPSEFSKLIFSSVFNINAQRVLPLGYPRDEYLFKSNGKYNLQKLTTKNIKNFKKIIFYLPTFRNGCNRNDSKNIFNDNLLNLEKYNENDLLTFLKENNYLLVVKKHPAELNNITQIDDSNILILNESLMNDNLITIYELLNAADLLIADYSSVYVEFLLLEKPVLFFHRDFDIYSSNRGIILDNSNIWFPGPEVSNINDFFSNISKLLNDTKYYNLERKQFKELMLSKNTSNICSNIFSYFFDTKTLELKHMPYISIEDKLENNIYTLNKNIDSLKVDIQNLTNKNEELQQNNEYLRNELSTIYNSRSWKFFKIFQRIKKGGIS